MILDVHTVSKKFFLNGETHFYASIVQGRSFYFSTLYSSGEYIAANRLHKTLSSEGKKYVIKNMIPGEFEYQLDLQKRISSPNVRAVVDTIQDNEIFISPFSTGDLLHLSQKLRYKTERINVLRCALSGLADIHGKDTLHNGKFLQVLYVNI